MQGGGREKGERKRERGREKGKGGGKRGRRRKGEEREGWSDLMSYDCHIISH